MRTFEGERRPCDEVSPRIGFGLSAVVSMVLLGFLTIKAFAQRSRIVWNNQEVVAKQIELSDREPFTLPKASYGTVWIALDPMRLLVTRDGQQQTRSLQAGEAQFTDGDLQFQADRQGRSRLSLIVAKKPHQKLTISPGFLSGQDVEDASERDATLLVAISAVRFRDTRNLGDESEWIPSKPRVITMGPASITRLPAGIHRFHQLSRKRANVVAIEW